MRAHAAQWIGTPSIKGSNESIRMGLLTCSLVGLQFTWSVEMAYCTPYLLQLGLTKPQLSLVWLAGPLSGLIMQPVVGVLADKSKSKYGRRRPVMVIAAGFVAMSMFVLGWARDIVEVFIGGNEEMMRKLTLVLAVLALYATDFSINAVQCSSRSLIVDTLPTVKQQIGSAWAGRMSAIGSILSYMTGTIDLQFFMGNFFGDTQLKRLIVIAIVALCAAVIITSWAVQERVLILDGSDSTQPETLSSMLLTILQTLRNLPPRIYALCIIQFWVGIGWFPFAFYSSTWVGETYMKYDASELERNAPDSYTKVAPIGASAMLLYSVVLLSSNLLVPLFVKSPEDDDIRRSFTPRPPRALKGVLSWFQNHKPDLLTCWMSSQLGFASIMIFAPFISSFHAAALLVALCGVPAAIADWASFAYLGIEINRVPTSVVSMTARRHGRNSSSSSTILLNAFNPKTSRTIHDSIDLDNANNEEDGTTLHLRQDSSSSINDSASTNPLLNPNSSPSSREYRKTVRNNVNNKLLFNHGSSADQNGELAGIYLGIFNFYCVLPQFVATGISMVVFSIFESPDHNASLSNTVKADEKGTGSRDNVGLVTRQKINAGLIGKGNQVSGIAVCLFIGALCSLVAAWKTRKFQKDTRGSY